MKVENTPKLAKAIKDRRNAMRYTLADVAEMVGISKSAYNRIEQNHIKNIDEETYYRILDALDISPSQVSDGSMYSDLHIRIPSDLKVKIDALKMERNVESLNLFITGILEEYVKESSLSKARYEIEEIVKESLHAPVSDIKNLLFVQEEFLKLLLIDNRNMDESYINMIRNRAKENLIKRHRASR
ncbi:MAG: helix-turn-helix transcriptional regulator [Parasporobacterium sp.]|nr:helix-turn-helix transcriptional regulator [Holdemanella sp.]MCF0229008.1 helix-turn-helix transcriptional regulator [Parasporobacterium sp.]